MTQRFLDPGVLSSLSSLELIAKTVVDGFVSGLHRSPDFGFSQEFAEYRAYTQGDDLRHVDWNLFARTERCYLKRYEGDTNSQLLILLDSSNSMQYASGIISKADYARFLSASLFYLAIKNQHDAAGIVVFDDNVREYISPSTRQGQLSRLFAALDRAEPRARTNFSIPFQYVQSLVHRRGIIIVLSDFYEDPVTLMRSLELLKLKGNDIVLFHILDEQELQPTLSHPALFVDLESGSKIEVVPEYVKTTYRTKLQNHIEQLRSRSSAVGLEYQLIVTNQPLDATLREYLAVRKAGI